MVTTLTRIFAPLVPGAICRGRPHDGTGAPCLYLTFDDGPDPSGTPRLLERLAAHDARATFFLLGEHAVRDPGLVRALAEAGHAVGNHGWDHRDGWRRPGTVGNLARGEAVLADILGRAVHDVRPPYGRITPATLRWARTDGRRLVLWDLMPGDYFQSASPDALSRTIRGRARPGSVVVLHDGEPAARAAGALDDALPVLRAAGWRFPPL